MSCYCGSWDCRKCGSAPSEYYERESVKEAAETRMQADNSHLRTKNAQLIAAGQAVIDAIDNKPGDDLGQRAMARALLKLRAALKE